MHLQAMFLMYFSFYKYLSKFIVLLGFFSFSWNKLVRCTRLNPTIKNVYDDDDDVGRLYHYMVLLSSAVDVSVDLVGVFVQFFFGALKLSENQTYLGISYLSSTKMFP